MQPFFASFVSTRQMEASQNHVKAFPLGARQPGLPRRLGLHLISFVPKNALKLFTVRFFIVDDEYVAGFVHDNNLLILKGRCKASKKEKKFLRLGARTALSAWFSQISRADKAVHAL